MGNGLPFNSLCCPGKYSKIEDIDINKNTYNDNTIRITRKELNQVNNQNKIEDVKLKKLKTHSKLSSEADSKKRIPNYKKRDSISHRDPNISLYNNTFQILNNTQQYISFSNMNFLKNNLINGNQILKSIYNSRINSSVINFSRLNSKLEDLLDVNIKLIITGDLFLNRTIEINKFGMKNGLRQKKDGVAIFGCKEENNKQGLYDYYIDLNLLKKQKKGKKKNIKGQIFVIFLDKKEKIFSLNFVHSSLLLYYKINNNLAFEIDKDYYLILGDILLTINVKRSNNSNGKIIYEKNKITNQTYSNLYSNEKAGIFKKKRGEIIIPKPINKKIHIKNSKNTSNQIKKAKKKIESRNKKFEADEKISGRTENYKKMGGNIHINESFKTKEENRNLNTSNNLYSSPNTTGRIFTIQPINVNRNTNLMSKKIIKTKQKIKIK